MDNPNTTERSGTIMVSGGGINDTLFVTQTAQPFALAIVPSELNVGYIGDDTTFTVTSNTEWTINKDVAWLNISPESDSGNGIITVTYTDNPDIVVRSAKVIVNGGGNSDTVTIHQDPKNFLSVSPTEINLSSDLGNFNLIINSNTNWVLKNNLEWISLTKYTGSNSDTVNVSYESNEEITGREGLILAYEGDDSDRVTIHQNAQTYLLVTADTNVVSADSGSIMINVESNTSWSVSDSVNWIIIIPESGSDSAYIKIIYSANIDSLKRTGALFFAADTITNKFILEQEGLEIYNIAVLAYPADAGTVSGGGKYLFGMNVKVVAVPIDGWTFKNWKEDTLDVSSDSVYNFVALSARTLTAEFEKIVGVKNEEEFPHTFELSQNYPNPFNPSTIIKYSIPELSFVIIKIYDILGNEIATLVNQEQSAGYYYLNFNLPSLSSGIYFYQLRAGSYVQTKKMIMLK